MDMTLHLCEAQDKITCTLQHFQLQYLMDHYMNGLKTCTGDNSDRFTSWLLSVAKVTKLIDDKPRNICFAKAEGNLFKYLHTLPLKKFSWHSIKEEIWAEFSKVATASHASLTVINFKQQIGESLKSSTYRWRELLLQSYSISEQYIDKQKYISFPLKYSNENYPGGSFKSILKLCHMLFI